VAPARRDGREWVTRVQMAQQLQRPFAVEVSTPPALPRTRVLSKPVQEARPFAGAPSGGRRGRPVGTGGSRVQITGVEIIPSEHALRRANPPREGDGPVGLPVVRQPAWRPHRGSLELASCSKEG
jgi:hypothetical protein